jgi:hypothetical protein
VRLLPLAVLESSSATLIYIKLVGYYRSYLENLDYTEAEVGQYQIFLTLYSSATSWQQLQLRGEQGRGSYQHLGVHSVHRCTAEAGDDVKILSNLAQVFPKLAPLR